MSFDNTPSMLESAHIQRDKTNSYYEEINISGSDLVIYHDENGFLTADNVSVWATKYGIGSGGQTLSSSWASASYVSQYASQSISASYATTASYLLGGAGNSNSASWASSSYVAQYASQSISASYAITASYLIGGAGNSDSASWASSSYVAQYASQSISASYAITASYVSASNVGGTVPTAFSASWASASISSSYAPYADTSSYTITVATASYILASGVDGTVASASRAISSSHADYADEAYYAISASYAPSSGEITRSVSASNADTASFALVTQNSLTSDFAVLAGNTIFTSSYALTASVALNVSPTASYALTASFALNVSPTASFLTNAGYVPSITTQYYAVGAKPVAISNAYSTSLAVTLGENTNVYVKFTVHGNDSTYGTTFFAGEYYLQKDGANTVDGLQPGNIISQFNSNPNVNVQSLIPDIAMQSGSAVLAIQLAATASYTGSLVYEIRGPFIVLDQQFVPISGSAYGDNFEAYGLGPISILSIPSPVFDADGSVTSTGVWGVLAIEYMGAYASGSTPSLTSGAGWAAAGTVN